jgi:hypothetical protein
MEYALAFSQCMALNLKEKIEVYVSLSSMQSYGSHKCKVLKQTDLVILFLFRNKLPRLTA